MSVSVLQNNSVENRIVYCLSRTPILCAATAAIALVGKLYASVTGNRVPAWITSQSLGDCVVQLFFISVESIRWLFPGNSQQAPAAVVVVPPAAQAQEGAAPQEGEDLCQEEDQPGALGETDLSEEGEPFGVANPAAPSVIGEADPEPGATLLAPLPKKLDLVAPARAEDPVEQCNARLSALIQRQVDMVSAQCSVLLKERGELLRLLRVSDPNYSDFQKSQTPGERTAFDQVLQRPDFVELDQQRKAAVEELRRLRTPPALF